MIGMSSLIEVDELITNCVIECYKLQNPVMAVTGAVSVIVDKARFGSLTINEVGHERPVGTASISQYFSHAKEEKLRPRINTIYFKKFNCKLTKLRWSEGLLNASLGVP